MATETSNSIKQQKFYKAEASSDSEIIMCPEKIPSLKVLSSLKKQNNYARALKRNIFTGPRDLQVWNPEFRTYFATKNSKSDSSLKRTGSKINYNFITFTEQYVQTSEVRSSKPLTVEKCVQTDFPSVTWVGSFSKDSTKLAEKGTNTESFEENELIASKNEQNTKLELIQPEHIETHSTLPSNILDINEIENIISSLLSSPLKMLQCKHINKLSGGNTSNPPGFVNLIIRQSDFMPLLVSGTEHRKETSTQYVTKDNCLFPYVYYVKQTIFPITYTQGETNCRESVEEMQCSDSTLDLCPSMNYNNKVGKTEYSVEYKIADDTNKNPHTTNTLQIDYENPLASGRIVLTEFRNSQSSSQSEMLSRILAHLIGLPNTQEKK